MKEVKPDKVLGRKAYGSTPHLHGSRIGPGDHHCHEGQSVICTEKPRDKHDRIIVSVKLDGSCVAVYRKSETELLALMRAGYAAESSPHEQHHLFADWVRREAARFHGALKPGEFLAGEWLAQAHGTRYVLTHEPFVPFALKTADGIRKPWDLMLERARAAGLTTPTVISDGPPLSIEAVKDFIQVPRHGEQDACEGAVWLVERRGVYDFVAKWVRPDKVDGSYLPEQIAVSDLGEPVMSEPVWNWRPAVEAIQ